MQSPLETTVQELRNTRRVEDLRVDRYKHSISIAGGKTLGPQHQHARAGAAATPTGALAIAALVALLLPPSTAYTQPVSEKTLSSSDISPDNCSAGTSHSWAVIADPTASSGTAIEHSRTAPTEASEALDICRSAALKDGKLSVRFKILSGADEGGGLALRMATPKDYYLVKIDAVRDRVSFLLMQNGSAEEIAGVDADVAVETWHTLAVQMEDDSFAVYLDGNWIFTAFDKKLPVAGHIALWAEPGSITRFDSVALDRTEKPLSWR